MQDEPFGWRLFDFRGISIQDNKSSKCMFNPESIYATWRISMLFWAQICYSNVALLVGQTFVIKAGPE